MSGHSCEPGFVRFKLQNGLLGMEVWVNYMSGDCSEETLESVNIGRKAWAKWDSAEVFSAKNVCNKIQSLIQSSSQTFLIQVIRYLKFLAEDTPWESHKVILTGNQPDASTTWSFEANWHLHDHRLMLLLGDMNGVNAFKCMYIHGGLGTHVWLICLNVHRLTAFGAPLHLWGFIGLVKPPPKKATSQILTWRTAQHSSTTPHPDDRFDVTGRLDLSILRSFIFRYGRFRSSETRPLETKKNGDQSQGSEWSTNPLGPYMSDIRSKLL